MESTKLNTANTSLRVGNGTGLSEDRKSWFERKLNRFSECLNKSQENLSQEISESYLSLAQNELNAMCSVYMLELSKREGDDLESYMARFRLQRLGRKLDEAENLLQAITCPN